jgi:hypothetical protein
MAIDPTQIELTLEQKQLVASLAEQAGKQWPEVLSEALHHYRPPGAPAPVSDAGTFYDSMQDVIGAVKGAPPDLSTNSAYLESLGRDCDAGSN